MKAAIGYYSIIQFCPSAERSEGVNVGVLLFSPAHRFIRALFVSSLERPRRLFFKDGLFDREALKASRTALEQRLQNDADSFRSLSDLEAFVSSRSADLRLTTPRSQKVFDPEQDLSELFNEVVGGRKGKVSAGPIFPQLEGVFAALHKQGRAKLNELVTVPVLDREIRVPYIYQNGVQNLVLPRRFPPNEKRSLDIASLLAIEGDLLQRHPAGDGARKLIVASEFPSSAEPRLEGRVRSALQEYNVELVGIQEIQNFIRRVQHEAHAA